MLPVLYYDEPHPLEINTSHTLNTWWLMMMKKSVTFAASNNKEDDEMDNEDSVNEDQLSPDEGDDNDGERYETRQLVLEQTMKKKKGGGFQSMGLSFSVFKGVMKKGYRVPTPIQRKTIPIILDGKDVVAMARTGSGKTAAFLLPMFEKLRVHSTKIGIRALILSPTRELANQTMKFIKDLSKFTSLRAAVVLGGDKMDDQFTALHENPDIVVATPGRFLHLVVEMDLKLSSIDYVVFDEADRLFEMGFSEQLREILRRLPEMRQTLLFSATLPKLLVDFAKAGLKDPVLIRLDLDNKLSEHLQTSYFYCRHDDKPAILLHFLHDIIKTDQQTVVFVATKHDVEYLRHLLLADGMDSSFVYSSLDQTARKICIGKFLHKKTHVMIVTDVAARGIDIPLLDNVINYNFPSKPKLFVHRVGRVARAGRSGTAYSLVSPDEVPYLFDLHLFLGRSLTTTGTDGVFGSIPQMVIDGEEDALRHAHSMNSDLVSLKKVAANGMKQYIRSRNQPAPESVKRYKQIIHPIPTHPLFSGKLSSSEIARSQLLDSLKTYKPSQTIFEINSTTNSQAKGVMKLKRDIHSKLVAASREKIKDRMQEKSKMGGVRDMGGVRLASEEDLSGFNKTYKSKTTKESVGDQPYVSYTPSDHHTEKGLSIESGGTVSFDQQAAGAVLDLMGDENEKMKKSNNTMKWDRKRKRFIKENNNTNKEGVKKVKTESGSWISATFKSGRYNRWKQGSRQEGMYGGEEQDHDWKGRGSNKRGTGFKNGPTKGRYNTKGSSKRPHGGDGSKGKGGGRLKSVSDIMKKREKMDFMRKRKQMKGGRKRKK